MPRASKVRQANKLSTTHLAGSLVADHGSPYDLEVAVSSDLPDDERDAIWSIFADNMRGLYLDSSFGWDPRAKKRELFHPLSRFILARRGSGESSPLVAFIMFRFERESKEDVVYCYEIQVSPSARRNGLGKILLRQVTSIGVQQGMRKVMLTAFKANVDAMKFYQASGFTLDPMSPDYEDLDWLDEGEEEIDYQILSKPIEYM